MANEFMANETNEFMAVEILKRRENIQTKETMDIGTMLLIYSLSFSHMYIKCILIIITSIIPSDSLPNAQLSTPLSHFDVFF